VAFRIPSARCCPTFSPAAIKDDRHPAVVGKGSLEVFVMIDGITRHDEEQILTRGEFRLPLAFTALAQGVSGHHASTTQRECQQERVMAGRLVSRIDAGSGARNDSFRKELEECGCAGVHIERDPISGNTGERAVRCGADYQGSAIEGSPLRKLFHLRVDA
jgi:hypothetical protein